MARSLKIHGLTVGLQRLYVARFYFFILLQQFLHFRVDFMFLSFGTPFDQHQSISVKGPGIVLDRGSHFLLEKSAGHFENMKVASQDAIAAAMEMTTAFRDFRRGIIFNAANSFPAVLWLQGIHHQTDWWIPCSKLRISYPARVTRRWCVKMQRFRILQRDSNCHISLQLPSIEKRSSLQFVGWNQCQNSLQPCFWYHRGWLPEGYEAINIINGCFWFP